MRKRTLLAALLAALALLAGAVFLPIFDCPLCEMLTRPRSERDCVCNPHSKSNLLQLLNAREQVRERRNYAEGQGEAALNCEQCGKWPARLISTRNSEAGARSRWLCDHCAKTTSMQPPQKPPEPPKK